MGIAVLVAAAIAVALIPWKWAMALGPLLGLYVLAAILFKGRGQELLGAAGVAVAVGRWIQVVGLLIASVAGVRGLRASPGARPDLGAPPPAAPAPPDRGRWAAIAGLLVLSPVCAEYLPAYDNSTGYPARLLFGLLFFAPLYGAPALLIREMARRAGLGWSGILFLAGAFALVQAGVVDQSLFSTSYRELAHWDALRTATLIAPLGISAHMALTFVGGHVMCSYAAPIALVEGFRPDDHRPWLGRVGLAVTTVFYLAAAGLIHHGHQTTEASHASPAQVVGTLVVAGLLAVGAFGFGRRRGAIVERPAPRARTVLVGGLLAAIAFWAVPETWPGVGLAVTVLVLGGAMVARTARSSGWSNRHIVALAAGAVLSRALLAFTYDPLIGDVSATRKYLHNATLLGGLVVVASLAARRCGSDGRSASSDQRSEE